VPAIDILNFLLNIVYEFYRIMTSKNRSLEDSISYVVDSKGKQTAMVIDLKNKESRAWAEKVREDFMDWQVFEKWKNNPNKESVDFFDAIDKIIVEKESLDV
jgi:hypothetical protein